MGSTFAGLEIGKSGLSVSMQNMQITGHNIANAKTPGYTRQRVDTAAKPPAGSQYVVAQIYNKQTGQGVENLGVEQIRSSYLDQQFRNLNSDYNQYEYRSQALSYLTGLYEEMDDDSSMTSSIEDFFSAMNEFSKDTTSKEYRTNVQQQALSMTQNISYVYKEMISLWNDQNESVNTVAQSINSIADQLSKLNESIASYERTGQSANDLRDSRNLLLDELSGLVNITYSANAINDSMVDVKIGDAVLVNGSSYNQIAVTQSATADALTGIKKYELTLDSKTLDNTVPGGRITSGELFAHMQMLSGDTANNAGIPYYMNQMNAFVQDMAENINTIHAKGYTYPDGSTASTTGINFFKVGLDGSGNPDYSTVTAGNFTLSDEVLASVYNIAGSDTKIDLTATTTNSGNNKIALELFKDLNNSDYYSQLNSIVGHLSIVTETSQKSLDVSESLTKSVDKQRASISGVSVDEETTNIIMFQQMYSANARVITSIDDMLSTLISGTGRVGL